MDKKNHIEYKLLHFLWPSMEDPIRTILLIWKLAQVKVMDLVLQMVEQLLEVRLTFPLLFGANGGGPKLELCERQSVASGARRFMEVLMQLLEKVGEHFTAVLKY